MDAIEFETDITSRFIEIKDYEKVANRHVRVIILAGEEIANKSNKKSDFIDELLEKPISIRQNTMFLSRDEANER